MKEISNKVLIIMLAATVFLSIVGTALNIAIVKNKIAMPIITGKSTEGTVEVRIESVLNLVVTSEEINFGSGQVNGTTDISTEQINPNSFNPCIEVNGSYNSSNECRGIQIENIGNVYINLTLSSSQDGDSFFLGNNATDEFRFAVAEGNLSRNYSNSCKLNVNSGKSLFPTGTNYSSGFMNWTAITKNFNYTICHNFSFAYNARSLIVEVNLTIPADEASYNPGQERVAQLTFVGESIQ